MPCGPVVAAQGSRAVLVLGQQSHTRPAAPQGLASVTGTGGWRPAAPGRMLGRARAAAGLREPAFGSCKAAPRSPGNEQSIGLC